MSKKFDVKRPNIYMNEDLVQSAVQLDDLMKVKDTWKRNGCPDHMAHLQTAQDGQPYGFTIYYGLGPDEEEPETIRFEVNHTTVTNISAGTVEIDYSRKPVGKAVGFTS